MLYIYPAIIFVSVLLLPVTTEFWQQTFPNSSINAEFVLFITVIGYTIPYGLYLRREKPKTAKNYLRWMGAKYIVNERILFKNMLLGGIVFFILSIMILAIDFQTNDMPDTSSFKFTSGQLYGMALLFSSFFIILTCSDILRLQNSRQDFRLYFSRYYLEIALEEDDTKNIRSFFEKFLFLFNSHAKKELKLRITKLNEIYRRFVLKTDSEKLKLVKKLTKSLEENNERKTILILAEFIETDPEELVKKTSIKDLLEEYRYLIILVGAFVGLGVKFSNFFK